MRGGSGQQLACEQPLKAANACEASPGADDGVEAAHEQDEDESIADRLEGADEGVDERAEGLDDSEHAEHAEDSGEPEELHSGHVRRYDRNN